MEKQIIVSTITPCFRMKQYLEKFLEELPRQTFFDQMEVVLDHNEPTEEELLWVKNFQEKYPERIRHIVVPKVDPIGISMNRCIREARGEFVCIWNVDDLRTPNSIESQVKVLQNDPSAGISFGPYKIVRSFGATEGTMVNDIPRGEELTRSMITGPFIMFRKSICDAAGMFDEQLKSGADFDLSIRLNFHAKAKTTSDLLGYYLNEGKGASTRPNSLQPVERTVIELRYGIYDKIDYDFVEKAKSYDIQNIKINGEWKPVESYVPNYGKMMEERKKRWFKKGKRNFIFKKIIAYKSLRAFASKIKKKIHENNRPSNI